MAASIAGGVIYHVLTNDAVGNLEGFAAVGINAAMVFVLLERARGAYHPTALLGASKQIQKIVVNWGLTLFFIVALLFLIKLSGHYSRGSALAFALVGGGALLTSRVIIASKLRDVLMRGTLVGRPAVVIGDAGELSALSPEHFLQTCGAHELARFEFSNEKGEDGPITQHDLLVVDNAIHAARTYRAEEILLAMPWTDVQRRNLVCEKLRALPLPVFLLPDQHVRPLLAQPTAEIGSQLAVEIQRTPLTYTELAAKRIFDLMLASTALVVLSPLLAFVAVAIKLDSKGPVIFRQRRKGFNGREFTIYKFRTMLVLEDGDTIRQARRNDERVTRVGSLLRSTSIDELPQLINVLRGEMSVTGPRPHAVAHDSEFAKAIANYAYRHHVKPGITGWAQVNGFRGETAELELMTRRIELDLWYINNWSFWLDAQIIARTCLEIARGRNAY